jgi:sortase A
MKSPISSKLRAPKLKAPSTKTLRRALTALALSLALGGTALVAYPFATDLWAAKLQGGLTTAFAAADPKIYAAGNTKSGDPLTRMQIPAIDLDTIVVEGTSPNALHAGAGHYPDTPLPGDGGNVAIAGHRTTYGKPFSRIDELVPGNKIVLTTPIGIETYEVVARPFVVDDLDWSPIKDYPQKGSYLTLTSCHPEGSADYRIVVRAQLVQSTDVVASKKAATG